MNKLMDLMYRLDGPHAPMWFTIPVGAVLGAMAGLLFVGMFLAAFVALLTTPETANYLMSGWPPRIGAWGGLAIGGIIGYLWSKRGWTVYPHVDC